MIVSMIYIVQDISMLKETLPHVDVGVEYENPLVPTLPLLRAKQIIRYMGSLLSSSCSNHANFHHH